MFNRTNGHTSGTVSTLEAEGIEKPVSLGTGPIMLMRALGFDPTMLLAMVTEFEQAFKAGMRTLVDRSQAIDEGLKALHEQMRQQDARLTAIDERLQALDTRSDKNFEAFSIFCADITRHLQAIAAGPAEQTPKLGPVRETKRTKAN
jgi:Arc/MetJ-type ribon-helix-helix transcriptional regulator